MKKNILFFVLAFLFISGAKIIAAEELTGYQNPKGIILAAPANGYSTTADHVSILGTCNPELPLYRNGKPVEITEHGFFTEYVSLDIGENTFVFRNGSKFRMITIVRTKAASSGSTASAYNSYKTEKYGVIQMDNATHRSKADISDELLTPLNLGTTFRVLGTEGSYVKISDGTYVYQAAIKLYDGILEENVVTVGGSTYDSENNTCVIQYNMKVNALYSVEVKEDYIDLTLYDTKSPEVGRTVRWNANTEWVFDYMESTENKKQNSITYRMFIKKGVLLNGYDVVFQDGKMLFTVKCAVVLKEDGSLKGSTIVLDAGHGDHDSGALGPMGAYGALEKDLNLNIMLHTKKYLEDRGAKVVAVREDDTFYALSERTALIKKNKPDISVSIHNNSMDYSVDYKKATGYITMYSYDYFNRVPEQINRLVAGSLGFLKNESRQRNLALTRITNCPALLLEIGFMSNPQEYEYLINENNQKKVGESVGAAIETYLKSISSKDSGQIR